MKLTFDVPEEMAEKIAENIKVALEEHKQKQVWPQKGDKYWYIRYDNTIGHTVWDNMTEEFQMLEIGNTFRTQEEAEFKTEQLKVLHELEQLADDDQPFDKDGGYSHVCIQYDWKYNKCHPTPNFRYSTYSPFHFKSVESCQTAIDKIGEERLKKYYFGTKDVV